MHFYQYVLFCEICKINNPYCLTIGDTCEKMVKLHIYTSNVQLNKFRGS